MEPAIPNCVAAGGHVQEWSGDGNSLIPRKLVGTVQNDEQQRQFELRNKQELMSFKKQELNLVRVTFIQCKVDGMLITSALSYNYYLGDKVH